MSDIMCHACGSSGENFKTQDGWCTKCHYLTTNESLSSTFCIICGLQLYQSYAAYHLTCKNEACISTHIATYFDCKKCDQSARFNIVTKKTNHIIGRFGEEKLDKAQDEDHLAYESHGFMCAECDGPCANVIAPRIGERTHHINLVTSEIDQEKDEDHRPVWP